MLSSDLDAAWLSQGLQEHGFSMIELPFPMRPDARDAVARALEGARPDAVIYQVDVPSSVSVEALRKVRNLQVLHDLPSLILTSESEQLHRHVGPTAVYDVVLETPCDARVVARAMMLLVEECRAP